MTGSGNRPGGAGFADTDWFTPVDRAAANTSTAVLDGDFRAWRSEFPDFYDRDSESFGQLPDADESAYSGSLSITDSDVRVALGPQADELMAAANVDVDELIRLINAETTVLPVIPDELSADRAYALPMTEEDEAPAEVLTGIRRWKKTVLKATIASILVSLIGGGAAAIAMNKSVTVDIDGEAHQVSTYADTVGEVLEDEGLNVGSHDALSPSPSASINDGGKIVLQRGRQLHMTIDGQRRDFWVRATTVGEAMQQLNISAEGAKLSADDGQGDPAQRDVPRGQDAQDHHVLRRRQRPDGDADHRGHRRRAAQAAEADARPRGHRRRRAPTSRSPTAPRCGSPATASP